jgi:hypothetical protein
MKQKLHYAVSCRLRRDELKAQRRDVRLAGTDGDRCDGAVKMGDLAVRVAETGTLEARRGRNRAANDRKS